MSIEEWKAKGYTKEHVFPDEYTLLIHPKTLHKVRVYEDGREWVTDPKTGKYHRVE